MTDNFRKYAVILALFAACLCAGCRKSGPAVAVPPDCQRFLDKYFAALKAKDVATLQGFLVQLSPAETENMSEASLAMMRESKKKMYADNFQHMYQQFGDFENYTVVSLKETTITREELAAKQMQGTELQGTHTHVLCKARFSKKDDAVISLSLFKERADSDYVVEAWQFQAGL